MSTDIKVFIGFDSREAVAAKVLAHSIRRRTYKNPSIYMLEHRNLRSQGFFRRPWEVEAKTGNWRDLIDGRPFSTEFSHSRFLVPELCDYQGWALFLDCDMIFTSDIKALSTLCDDQYAVMCVKHNQIVKSGETKMDNRPNESYQKKNWSSFMLFNCGHPANRDLTKEAVNYSDGSWLHNFGWLGGAEHLIGSLPKSYNYISGTSPALPPEELKVIHYTLGGPWFDECKDVSLGDLWTVEFEHWSRDADHGAPMPYPSTKYDRERGKK